MTEINYQNRSLGQGEEELALATSNYISNKRLKINPKYQIQTRPLTHSEYERLKDSINKIRRLDQPIIIDEDGYILDGHHRLKVCEELGIKPWVEIRNYGSEEQKIEAINQLNLARRHCSKWELYMATERMRPRFEAEVRAEQELKYQKGKKGTQPIGVKNLTPIRIIDNNDISSSDLEKKDGRINRKIGDIVGVSRTTIWQWKQVKDNSSEQQLKALSEGKIEPYDLFKKMKAAKTREKLAQHSIGINSKFQIPDGATIYCGDFRDPLILAKIPDGSVSLILLDPLYAEKFWDLYEAIPPIAMAKLKPNGHLVSLFGDTMKRRYMNILEAEGLIYNTDISVQLRGPFNHDQHLHISRKKKDFLWYYKGPELMTNGLLQNLIPSERSSKDLHEMQQPTKEAEEIISRLTFPDAGDVVLDLMMGAGTNIKAALNCGAGRKGIGIEIDRTTYEIARAYITTAFPSDTNQGFF